MDHPQFRLAVDVCNATSDRLQRDVAQYFTDIIVSHDDDGTEDDDIQRAHDLIIQMNKSCPALLNNVVPQLEEELGVDNVLLRTIATKTLGAMFAENGGESLAKKYPATWKSWITRTRDKSPAVRVAFVEACKRLMIHYNVLSTEVERECRCMPVEDLDSKIDLVEAVQSKLLDGDEKVRAAACRIYAQLDYETALHHVSLDQLKQVSERIMDRKVGRPRTVISHPSDLNAQFTAVCTT